MADAATVLLQAMAQEPEEGFKCRDKFLVQSVAIKADRETLNVQEVVSNIDARCPKPTG